MREWGESVFFVFRQTIGHASSRDTAKWHTTVRGKMAASISRNIERMNKELDNLRHAYHRMMSYNAKINQHIEDAN